jgi:hypothetical protein
MKIVIGIKRVYSSARKFNVERVYEKHILPLSNKSHYIYVSLPM